MYCFNCGTELTKSQLYCPNCGTKNQALETAVTPVNSGFSQLRDSNTDYDRGVLENYLDNLRVLEFSKNKIIEEMDKLSNRIRALGLARDIKRKSIKPYVSTIIYCILIMMVCWIPLICIGNSLWKEIPPFLYILYSLPMVLVVAMIICIIKAFIDYNKRIEEDKLRVKRESDEKEFLLSIHTKYDKDLKDTEKLLQEAYSINIVPDKYRNLGAIYFLHKNFITSMMSFNDVLYHCDFNEINQSIGLVVQQQREMVMELAYNNSLNELMIDQNNKMINSAIRQEQNLRRIEQYEKMQTYYAKTNAQIQSYFFIKDLFS